MFNDETLASVSVPSLWRQSHQSVLDSKSCQTRPLRSADAEVQALELSDCGAQTEDQELSVHQQNPDELLKPELALFLKRVEDTVVRALVRNSRSHAFDGFDLSGSDHSEAVSRLHCLRHPPAQDRGLQVTAVSWSCTGAVVACAFGRIDDGDWSNEKSFVCTWNLSRRGLSASHPDLVIDVPTAVTALSCHPQQPALIAGGLYSGEVLVWDTSQTQDPVRAQTSLSADSHREPVYQVSWKRLQSDWGILSACSGGRVLLWSLSLSLSSGFALVQQQLPLNSSSYKSRGSGLVGVSALAQSPWDPDAFLVGSEGGLLLRCSFSSQTVAQVQTEGHSVTLRAPAVFSFRRQCGPVHSIHCSPFHRNLFVSAGTDGLAHVHSLLQAAPVLSVRVSDSYVHQVQWSPSRALVFAAVTGQGELQIFDLGRGSLKPAVVVETGGKGHAATSLAFNPQDAGLVAVGNTDGTISVWKLSRDLTEAQQRDLRQLEQILHNATE